MLKSELDNLIKDNFGKKYDSTLEEFTKPIEIDEILKAFKNNSDRFVKTHFFTQVRAHGVVFRVYNQTYAGEQMWEAECNGRHWKILDTYSCVEV